MTETTVPQRTALTAMAALKQAATAAKVDFSIAWLAKSDTWRLQLGSLVWESEDENAAIIEALDTVLNSYRQDDK